MHLEAARFIAKLHDDDCLLTYEVGLYIINAMIHVHVL